MYIEVYMAKIKLENGKIELKDNYSLIFEKTITKFGNGAKIDCPKEFLGKKVYVIIRED
jgi:putative transposon-encoded protein